MSMSANTRQAKAPPPKAKAIAMGLPPPMSGAGDRGMIIQRTVVMASICCSKQYLHTSMCAIIRLTSERHLQWYVLCSTGVVSLLLVAFFAPHMLTPV